MKLIHQILAFFFPPECLGCKAEDYLICPACLQNIPNKTQQKSFSFAGFHRVFVCTDYENSVVQRAIKKLKYRFARNIIHDLEPFFRNIFEDLEFPSKSVFVPVPLHFMRHNQRGFNQSELLAEMFSKILYGKKRVVPLLKRTRNTPHQSMLSKKDRETNVQNAFIVNQKIVKQYDDATPIILIDDVISTGSTLLECAKALSQNGYENIYGLVIAKGS